MHLQLNLVRDGVKIESTDLVEIVNFQNAHGITKSLELEYVWEMSQTGQSLLYLKKER